ncbi:MAG: PBP1A family penicillin-binding protein [Alphaproteobacteria bacterium]|nr:PBP1A family penicillin-binding protein [Alphaproteobacteria bacterium]
MVTIVFAIGLVGAVAAVGGAFALISYYARDLPDHAGLKDYQPPVMTRIHAGDGRLMMEVATERRIFVPVDQIPPMVRQAFVSAEDQNFYAHRGVDPIAVARAVIVNVQNYGQGRRPIGASTITQQVAKNMLLGNEVSFARKVREAVLALRIEEVLPKDRILELYLNEIYLGQSAYGVASAAMTYFNKSLDEITLAEAAYLAALPKAPNNYNPWRNPEAAKVRRDWVIDRMLEDRAITAEEAAAARAEPIRVRPSRLPDMVTASYYAEETRRHLVERFGLQAVNEGGLSVRTSLNPELQAMADRALRAGLLSYDRRRGGWRGAERRLDLPAQQLRSGWAAALAAVPRMPGMLREWQLGVVVELNDQRALVGWLERADGRAAPQSRTGILPMAEMTWARRALDEGRLGPVPRNPRDVVAPGDVIMVEPVQAPAPSGNGARGQAQAAQQAAQVPQGAQRLALRQIPEVEGALVALDPHTGRVMAMSGGWSFEKSQFNRATQAQRQPGSSFKPYIYLAALEYGMTPATRLLDAPICFDQGPGLPRWCPSNFSNNFNFYITLRRALERSLNLVTVRLANELGMDTVADYAARFGVVDRMPPALAASLGAVETTVLRQAAGFAMFVNGGRRVVPTLIDTVQDRNGRMIWRADQRECGECRAEAVGGRTPPVVPDTRPQVIDPGAAYQMVSILQGAVQRGTGGRAALNRPVAGKTGTTNDVLDTWFVGFTPDMVTAVWVGFDEPSPLGGETGGSLAAPIFRDFMTEAMAGRPPVPFRIPPGLRFVRINPVTGMEASGPGSVMEAFRPGTGPNETAEPEMGEGGHTGAAALDTGLGGLY